MYQLLTFENTSLSLSSVTAIAKLLTNTVRDSLLPTTSGFSDLSVSMATSDDDDVIADGWLPEVAGDLITDGIEELSAFFI